MSASATSTEFSLSPAQQPMLLQLNGEQRNFPDLANLAALVEHLGMKADRVAVELNLEIVPRSNWKATSLKDGDKLEIVHFVGGGKETPKRKDLGMHTESSRGKDFSMNHDEEEPRQRYIVVFGKNAMDLEEKLNSPSFVPAGYKVVQLTFNSQQGEYLAILENEWR